MKQTKIAALLAACLALGTSTILLAQTSAGGKKVKPPSETTGSGKDTGMNVPSSESGNGPGGVGTVGAGTAVGATPRPTKTSGASHKKKAKHTQKKTMSSTQ